MEILHNDESNNTKKTTMTSKTSSILDNYRSEELVFELENEQLDVSTSHSQSYTCSSSDELQQHSLDVQKTTKRTRIVAFLVVLVGAAASAAFLYVGISSTKDDIEETFKRRASDMAKEVDGAWKDYESHALWVHESCRNWRTDNFSHDDFEVLYEYIVSGGLDLYMIEWVPNVTRAERPALEEEAFEYWANDPNFNYTGMTGLEPDPEHPGELAVSTRSEQEFYFPVQFGQPKEKLYGIFHFDLWSFPGQDVAMNYAVETFGPALTGRLQLVEHSEEDGYSVILFHPGTPLSDKFHTKPRDFVDMVIHVQALLKRASRSQSERMAVYLFDKTVTTMDGSPPEFLEAIEIQPVEKGIVEGEQETDVILLPEVDYESLKDSRLYFEMEMAIGGRTWVIGAVPVEGTYEPDYKFIVTTGVTLFLASALLALWMLHNMRRSIHLHNVITKAAAEASIVTNLFPANVRTRMIQDAEAQNQKIRELQQKNATFLAGGVRKSPRLQSLLTSEGIFGSKPIAELHPYTTVMVADLVGFTAWASVREPSQVFTLLEIIYHSFDTIAKRRRVYKVETVGDSYVAVTGLPSPRKDHAVVMSRFATDCLHRMQKLVRALEKTLGPDTADLGCRVGLHSGQVIAGVLRGDKGRFQLFGDTINMASRMESTGVRNKIQISQETADLLDEHGHEKWVVPREEMVEVKGKGTLQTYFLHVTSSSTTSSKVAEINQLMLGGDNSKTERLVEWNTVVLLGLLRNIMARRAAASSTPSKSGRGGGPGANAKQSSVPGGTVLDEVAEIIALPEFNAAAVQKQVDPESIELDPDVVTQLENLITTIASMYRSNPFHSFEHASHVTMSVIKMLGRIVDPKLIAAKKKSQKLSPDYDQMDTLEAELHDHTFGITSDPLTQFACAFSALIHDLDHQGIPNMVLVKEESRLAQKYKNKSVAEQNSVDLAWELLMKPENDKLRACICQDGEEFHRFRSLVVNSVMATDIMDKELQGARKARWNKAFSDESEGLASTELETLQMKTNRKATIVIEHLIQASDISHTMQHWHVYAKWNERLFHEMYQAFKAGRLEQDPSIGWHKGELGFFDFYIIPLAKKLFTCGVFGVSSDEFLNYALVNRKEWEQKGEMMVQQYLKNYNEKCQGATTVETTPTNNDSGDDDDDGSDFTADIEDGDSL